MKYFIFILVLSLVAGGFVFPHQASASVALRSFGGRIGLPTAPCPLTIKPVGAFPISYYLTIGKGFSMPKPGAWILGLYNPVTVPCGKVPVTPVTIYGTSKMPAL